METGLIYGVIRLILKILDDPKRLIRWEVWYYSLLRSCSAFCINSMIIRILNIIPVTRIMAAAATITTTTTTTNNNNNLEFILVMIIAITVAIIKAFSCYFDSRGQTRAM